MYILDTDQFTLLTRGDVTVLGRILMVSSNDVSISIVTVEELLTGWYTVLRKAKSTETEIRAYAGLFLAVQTFKKLEVLPFTPTAVQRFHELRKQHRRLGRMDLAIASIALEANAVLVTRNRSDFEQIPGLRIEDWSQV